MRHSRQKGNEAERRLEVWLETAGWAVHRARQSNFQKVVGPERCGACRGPLRTSWQSRANDVWGCFDLLASRRGCREWRIQVTSAAAGHAEKRRLIESHARGHAGIGELPADLWLFSWDTPSKKGSQKWAVELYLEQAGGRIGWAREYLTSAEVKALFRLELDQLERFDRTLPPPPCTDEQAPLPLAGDLLGEL